jgi:lipopolysaccharide transport system ATP-binding protein
MSESPILSLKHVDKTFRVYASPWHRLKELLMGGLHHHENPVLRDVNFILKKGEALGLLGCNGAGKSTLLKLILGILYPDTGQITRVGRITGLLELGTGFDPALSGRENIYVNGLLLGIPEEDLRQKEGHIISFAELDDYIDQPVRTYSSGMAMRLGFAIAIHADPSCFIIDEALAVGDIRFQQKCFDYLKKFRAGGGSLLLVSHDLNAIRHLCDRVLVLNKGSLVFDGAPDAAGQCYYELMSTVPVSADSLKLPGWGRQAVYVKKVMLTDQTQHELREVDLGQAIRLNVEIYATIARDLTIGFMIKDRFGQELFGTNTALMGQSICVKAGQDHTFVFEWPVHMAPGSYTISVALHGGTYHADDCEHWWDQAYSFDVQSPLNYSSIGLLWQPVQLLDVKTD